jgi:hypothetical protein
MSLEKNVTCGIGTRPIPTKEELISELPEMIWPELGE